ncbi:hypothetical protein COT97_05385 [Candidatus Falkowbacteria bacterium CG10_big_fil_rev_8_21_14_0_10_39_11]|uniref:NTP pyrophosphohydrolase MazG-like domain-containing protein n=1 Tax=Candidatus Falkowbacteria bacterium CG10_big_fil_rev_8_21_14_0_10_39_11 TaxID=1974565 RepID=A0A2H0V3L3_9BACT|nr:MAG: hypothetical protein COT97_05385 [Candidatus Falkowbacteria bacterium CG10_big_fil_rev_8_21_14_0_10_39_11]
MTFDDYQKIFRQTAIYPNKGNNYIYPVLGLAGETGEVADKIKKIIRDQGGVINSDNKEEIKKELGDILWYLAQLSTELNISFNDVALANLQKLYSRLKRDRLGGSGDNR